MNEMSDFHVLNKNEWNTFVKSCKYTSVLQMWEWAETKTLEGWVPLRSQYFDANDNLICVMQALVKKIPLLGNYVYIPHGPVFNDLQAFDQIKNNLLSGLKKDSFVIEIEPLLGVSQSEQELSSNLQLYTDQRVLKTLQQTGFHLTGRNMQPKYKLFYDLDQSEEELLARMKKNTRYNVRLAEKKGVVVDEISLDDPKIDQYLDEFYNLLLEMQQRAKGYPVRPKSSFKKLFDEFRGTDNIKLFRTSYQGDLIAINISEYTDFWASSFYAGSNRMHADVKAPYLMRWRSVQAAKRRGCKVYDFWGFIPGADEHKGYSDNKVSFGGERIDMHGILAYPIVKWKYFIWDKLIPLRTKVYELLRKFK